MKYADLRGAAAGITKWEQSVLRYEYELEDLNDQRRWESTGMRQRAVELTTAQQAKKVDALAKLAVAKAELNLAKRELNTFAARRAKGG